MLDLMFEIKMLFVAWVQGVAVENVIVATWWIGG